MKRFLALALAASLSACATMPDQCSGAAKRRVVYMTAIRAADLYALSGRAVPTSVSFGRRAAVTALAILDSSCPPYGGEPGATQPAFRTG